MRKSKRELIKMKVASIAYISILALILLYPANDEVQEEWLHLYLEKQSAN